MGTVWIVFYTPYDIISCPTADYEGKGMKLIIYYISYIFRYIIDYYNHYRHDMYVSNETVMDIRRRR